MEKDSKPYRKYSREQIEPIAREVSSLSALLKGLGLKPIGGNFINMKRRLQELVIDTSHWTGKAWNKNQRTKDWTKYTRTTRYKKHLIRERGERCERCSLTSWLGTPIPLEVHHIDGDRTNNDTGNIEILCPNCHALTSNFRGKKNEIKVKPEGTRVKPPRVRKTSGKKCAVCGGLISLKATKCRKCARLDQGNFIEWPRVESLLEQLLQSNYTRLAKELGVTDNAIRKHLKKNGILPPRKYGAIL